MAQHVECETTTKHTKKPKPNKQTNKEEKKKKGKKLKIKTIPPNSDFETMTIHRMHQQ
jgi:hypothetical protein